MTSSVPAAPVAAAEEFEKKDLLMAWLEEVSSKQLKISGTSLFEVCSINDTDCNLLALLDTGSPVSFIRSAIVEAFEGQKLNLTIRL